MMINKQNPLDHVVASVIAVIALVITGVIVGLMLAAQ